MKGKAYIGLWYALICIFVYQNVKAQNALNVIDIPGQNKLASAHLNTPPIATNDTIIHINNCIREITGNLFTNDFDPDGDNFRLYFAVTPLIGKFRITRKIRWI